MIGKRHWNYNRRFRTFIAHTDKIASDEHFWTLIAEIRLVTDPLIKMTSKLHLEVLHFMLFVVTYEEIDLFLTGLLRIVRNLLVLQPTSWFNKPIAAVDIISRLEIMRRGALKLLALFVHPQEYYNVCKEGQTYYDNLLRKIDAILDTIQAVIFQVMDKVGPDELLENDTDSHLLSFLLRARANEPVMKVTLEHFKANTVSPQLMQKVLSPEIWTWYDDILREEDMCTLCGHRIEEREPSDCMITAGCEHPYCSRCMPRLERSIDSLCKVVICEKEMQSYTSMDIVRQFVKYQQLCEMKARVRREREITLRQLVAGNTEQTRVRPQNLENFNTGLGLESASGAGLESASGAGLESASGAGLESASGAGLESASGASLESAFGAGLESASGAGLESASGAGFESASEAISESNITV